MRLPTFKNFKFGSLGIGDKLTLGFGAMILCMLLIMASNFFSGLGAIKNIGITEEIRVPTSLISADAQASMLQMQLHLRGYLVSGNRQDLEQYEAFKRLFETRLAEIESTFVASNATNDAHYAAELETMYRKWVQLPPRMFTLHDDPLQNRPALQLARVDAQPLRALVAREVQGIIKRHDVPVVSNRELTEQLLTFQASFDAMVTDLTAFAASNERHFKLSYDSQLDISNTAWAALSSKSQLLADWQKAGLDKLWLRRLELDALALKIFDIEAGPHADEDLFLYRTQIVPQATRMLNLLGEITNHQQVQLRNELKDARRGLAIARWETIIGGLIAVSIGISAGFLLRRHILEGLRRVTQMAEQVAAGDLSVRVKVESNDEIGTFAAMINTMTQRLSAIFEQAQDAKERAETANRAKTVFLANMSHELRTPLNGILGYAQILRRDKTLDESQKRGLQTIQESGEHLLMLLNDLLDFSRIESGKTELCPSDVGLSAFLAVIADIICIKAEQKDVVFTYEETLNLPCAVRVDERRLRQVLLNLLGNAVKFTDLGEVCLQTQVLSCNANGAVLRFEVRDTGVGISPEHFETIFKPFQQVGDVQRRQGGTGLGLAISRELVRLMGGDILVKSSPGNGSVFWFDLSLPLSDTAIARRPEWPAATAYDGRGKKVLIVEDVEANRQVLIDLLADLGFEILQAADGLKGVQQAQAARPDLILMDLRMPVMDGRQATRRIREIPGLDRTPIIVVSADSGPQEQAEILAMGANAYLSKPIDHDQLLHLVGAQLGIVPAADLPGAKKSTSQNGDYGPLTLPPLEEMKTLHHLALVGNMRSIDAHADRLIALDERYRAFAEELHTLTRAFRSKAIVAMVEKHLHQGQ